MGESDRFGPYIVHERLGAGGMATVHRATIELEDDELREVALKRLLPQFANDKRFVEDLIREGKLAAQLEHPNIVRILELGRIGKTYFIAMDLVRGDSLMSIMREAYEKNVQPPIAVVIQIVSELLDALDHAHAAQIVHRDLTPSNLIITDDGHLKVIDFGVAKALAGTLQTSSGLAKGKLGYMSMEAISGKHVDTRADIFAAGVVIWELLVMRRLFRGATDLELINAIRTHEVEPPSRFHPHCPGELDALVMRALERAPEDRWSSAHEMLEVLADLRRDYRATARDVRAWVDRLQAGTPAAHDEDDDEVEMEIVSPPVDDSFLDVREPVFAEGSDAGTYDDLETSTDLERPATGAFREVDTIVTASTFVTRKS